jgi:mono/diheme cytochrome c family protein
MTMSIPGRTPLAVGALVVGMLALAPPANAQSRGELLYSTHCIACHTSKMHWRDNRQATDWNSLETQVRRWQATAMLQWNDADIRAVAGYLNQSYYRFPRRPRSG